MTLSPENKAAQAIIDAGYNPATARDIARIAVNAARTEGSPPADGKPDLLLIIKGMLRLADMGFEQSLLEPEENGNYAVYVRAKAAVAAHEAAPSPAVRGLDREAGWLIERWDELKGHHGLWWTLSDHDDAGRWTKESSIALRFAREVDAQAYINEAGWTDARPTEHAWDLAALPLAGQGEEGWVPTAEQIARCLAETTGSDPDEDAPLGMICTAESGPLPWWHFYEEQGAAVRDLVLAALPSQPEGQSGWRLIDDETPRDGSTLLLAHHAAVFTGNWQDEGGNGPGWVAGETDRYEDLIVYDPTHWQPLPALPEPPAQGGENG